LTVGHTYEGWMGEGTLARAPLLGGGVREMLEHVREADWAPDGSDLAIVRRENGRERLEFPPGRVLHDTAGYISNVRFAPKGDRIAFVDHPVYADDLGAVTIVDLEGQATVLSPAINSMRGLAWGPGGQEIWFSATNESGCLIDAVTLSGARRTVLTTWSLCTLLDVAPDGRALIGSETSLRQVEAITRASAEPRAFTLATDQAISRSITPDGNRLVFTDQAVTGYAAYVYPVSGAPPVRVGTGEAVDLSPDGRWLLALTQTTPSRIMLHPTGPGTTRELPNPDEIIVDHARWLPDGRRVVFFGRTSTGPARGYVQDVQSGSPVAFTPERVDPRAWWTFAVSPDGARVTMRGANGVVALAPVGGGAPQPLPQFPADAVPVQWSDDGRALIVGQRINAGWAVSRFDIATGRMQKIRDLVANDASGFRLTFLAASPNGQYMVHSYSRLLVDLYLVQGLR
jgi:eukaryotic-like serine/threonine-protein kinase